jgi:hypothetical protein
MKKPRLKHDEISRRLLALGCKPSSPAVASERGTVDGSPAPPSEDFLYRWAAMKARTDSPGVEELKAQGWTIEHVDHRYKTHLMRKELPDALPRARGLWPGEATLLAVAVLWLLVLLYVGVVEWRRMVNDAKTDNLVAEGDR